MASKQMSGNLGEKKVIILIMISVLQLSSPQEQDLWGVDWGVCVAQAGADWQLLHTREHKKFKNSLILSSSRGRSQIVYYVTRSLFLSLLQRVGK